MATLEQRVNISLDKTILEIIKQIAKNKHLSVSKVCAQFIQKHLEDDEDAYYVKLINEIGDISDKTKITATEMYRRLDELQD